MKIHHKCKRIAIAVLLPLCLAISALVVALTMQAGLAASDGIVIHGEKVVEGDGIPIGTAFTFAITQVNENHMPYTGTRVLTMPPPEEVTTDITRGKTYPFAFGEITGLEANSTYFFKVVESTGGGDGWTNDTSERFVTVEVDATGHAVIITGEQPFALNRNRTVRHAPPIVFNTVEYNTQSGNSCDFATLTKQADYIAGSGNAFDITLTATGNILVPSPIPVFTAMSLDITTSMRRRMDADEDGTREQSRIRELVAATQNFIRNYFYDTESGRYNTSNYLSIVLYRGYWAEFRVGLDTYINKGEPLGWVSVDAYGNLLNSNRNPIGLTVEDLCALVQILDNDVVRSGDYLADQTAWDYNYEAGRNGYNVGTPGRGPGDPAASVRRDGTNIQAGIYGAVAMLDATQSVIVPGSLPRSAYSYNALIMTDGRANQYYETQATNWAGAVVFDAGTDKPIAPNTEDHENGAILARAAGDILKGGSADGVIKPTVYSVIFSETADFAVDTMQYIATEATEPDKQYYHRAGEGGEGVIIFDAIRGDIADVPTISAGAVITDVVPGDMTITGVRTALVNPLAPYTPLTLSVFPGAEMRSGESLIVSRNGSSDWAVEWTIPQDIPFGVRAELVITVEVPPTCSDGEQRYYGKDAIQEYGHWLRNSNRAATFSYRNIIDENGWTVEYPNPLVHVPEQYESGMVFTNTYEELGGPMFPETGGHGVLAFSLLAIMLSMLSLGSLGAWIYHQSRKRRALYIQ